MVAFVFVTLTWTRTTERQCEGKGQTKASRWDLDQNTFSCHREKCRSFFALSISAVSFCISRLFS